MKHRNVLTLEPPDPEFVAKEFADYTRRKRATESQRLDIVIDGKPLRYWWQGWEQPDADYKVPVPDLVTMLTSTSRRDAIDQLSQLQGTGIGQPPARAELYYCAACFDISDGILSVEIDRTAEAVTWRALGWKDEEQDGAADALIPNTTDFTFDPVAYDSVLSRARADLSRNRHHPYLRFGKAYGR